MQRPQHDIDELQHGHCSKIRQFHERHAGPGQKDSDLIACLYIQPANRIYREANTTSRTTIHIPREGQNPNPVVLVVDWYLQSVPIRQK